MSAPDWGQDHLSPEAIVAFVDGELAAGPHARAAHHLDCCPECAYQVAAQGQARAELRTAGCPLLSSSLLSSLRSIPQDTDLPQPPPGLAMSADGQLVSVIRPERTDHGARIDSDAEPAGFRTAVTSEQHTTSRSVQRRLRLGTGVAVSGLALGALAFGAPSAAPPAPPAPVPATERGLPGATVLGGSPGYVDARLRLGSVSRPGPGPVGGAARESSATFDR